ncbi:MAG: FHA domain-containing protein [Bacteroides sp.]|nr:FHA domain-containing protein [Bacteroides sp.]MCM1549959.1 FHA domain-containing protein [Clostridium sp.]
MEAWLQNEGFHQYLIFNAEHADINCFEINMLMHYEGKGLLPLELQCKNGNVNISYEISGAASIQQVFQEKEMDGAVLQVLFTSLWECYEEMEAYLLPMEGVLLQPEWIYYQPGKKQIRFCYLPESEEAFYPGMLSLVEFCMKRTRHADSEAVLFIYGLYRLLQAGNAEWKELKEYIMGFTRELSGREMEKQVYPEPPVTYQSESDILYVPEMERADKAQLPSGKKLEKTEYIYAGLAMLSLGSGLFFGIRFLFLSHRETDIKLVIISVILLIIFLYSMIKSRKGTVIQKNEREKQAEEPDKDILLTVTDIPPEKTITDCVIPEETSILSTAVNIEAALWELESMQKQISGVALYHLPAVLGRKPEEVDYMVSGEGISRRHVLLFQSGEELYAEDLASTNGTCINGLRIPAGEPTRVRDGDRLSIGPNQYQVKRKH